MDKQYNELKDTQLYIIRGASGVGKSTVLKHLKEMLDRAFLVDIDSIRGKIAKMDWENGVSDFVNAQKITIAMVKETITLGYRIIIVADPFPKVLLESFLKEFTCPTHVFCLFCESDELLRRLEERGRPILHRDSIFRLNEEIRNHDLDTAEINTDQIVYIDNTQKDECVIDVFFQ